MELEIFNEAQKLWTRFARETPDTELEFSIEIHKKLLKFFQVGDYYYYIFNVTNSRFEFVSQEIQTILGYQPQEITVPFLLNSIHPEDLTWFLNCESKVGEFFTSLYQDRIANYKVRYDYRIRKKDGNYIRVLQQFVTIQAGGDTGVLRTFGVHTDITSLKKEGAPTLSFIGLNGQPSYHDVNVSKVFTTEPCILTSREKEILNLIVAGKKSEDIANHLFISKQTVDSHRKNLLRKTNCKNTASLVSMAVNKGFLSVLLFMFD